MKKSEFSSVFPQIVERCRGELLAENDAPLKKGVFSKFGDILSKYSWLVEIVAKLVVTYLTTGSL